MIRPAVPEDAPEIARIHVETWRTAYGGIIPASFLASLSLENRKAMWTRALAEGRSILLVDAEEERMTGWVSAGPSRDASHPSESEIYALYVLPSHWGRGIGHRLSQAVEAALPPSQPISLWVLAGNERAIRFYERAGYVFDGRTKEERFGDVCLVERRMLKSFSI